MFFLPFLCFRFSQLKSLNLSHNRLGVFPQCVCEILTLTELNLACNNIHIVPEQIGSLQRSATNTITHSNLVYLCSPNKLQNDGNNIWTFFS